MDALERIENSVAADWNLLDPIGVNAGPHTAAFTLNVSVTIRWAVAVEIKAVVPPPGWFQRLAAEVTVAEVLVYGIPVHRELHLELPDGRCACPSPFVGASDPSAPITAFQEAFVRVVSELDGTPLARLPPGVRRAVDEASA